MSDLQTIPLENRLRLFDKDFENASFLACVAVVCRSSATAIAIANANTLFDWNRYDLYKVLPLNWKLMNAFIDARLKFKCRSN